jgi:hypothetical protein
MGDKYHELQQEWESIVQGHTTRKGETCILTIKCKISAPSTPDKKMSPGETAMFILPNAPVNNIPPQGVNGVKVFCKPM